MKSELRSFGRSLIGDKAFYLKVLTLTLPIALQNGLVNVVGMLDNIMVGQLGTNEMSGVSISNNLLFILTMVIFGAVSAGGLFGAQYFGKGDHKGVANSFRSKIYLCLGALTIAIVIFVVFSKDLIGLYLNEETGDAKDIAETLDYALKYLMIMLLGLPALCLSTIYASTMRECNETVTPMRSGFVAVIIDLVLNYIMIFGKFGFPKLGVEGAAIATVISRYADCALNILWTHRHKDKMIFANYIFASFKVPADLLSKIVSKGLPIMLNEFMWVISIALIAQSYAYRGLTVVAASNIQSTLSNIFNIFFIAFGSAVGIIIGQLLGAGHLDEAKKMARKCIFFSFASSFVFSLLMFSCAWAFPTIYNTEADVKALATKLIIAYAILMPIMAYAHASYFTLRAGGKTLITLLMDGIFSIFLVFPLAYCLSHCTSLDIIYVYTIVEMTNLVKSIIATFFLEKLNWAVKLVS